MVIMAKELNIIDSDQHHLLFMGKTKEGNIKTLYINTYDNNQFSLSVNVGFKQVFECDDIEEAVLKYNSF